VTDVIKFVYEDYAVDESKQEGQLLL